MMHELVPEPLWATMAHWLRAVSPASRRPPDVRHGAEDTPAHASEAEGSRMDPGALDPRSNAA
jgi:hypothetical protein